MKNERGDYVLSPHDRDIVLAWAQAMSLEHDLTNDEIDVVENLEGKIDRDGGLVTFTDQLGREQRR